MSYLGHQARCGMLSVSEVRVTSMAYYGKPRTKKQLRLFLGSIGYYRLFVREFAKLSASLTPSVSLSAAFKVKWTQEIDEAFRILRESLCKCVVLHIPCVSDGFILYTDPSECGLGVCLYILRDKEEFPIAFFSRQLRWAEKTFSVMKLEALAIIAAVLHFEFYFYGSSLVVYTDYRAHY